MLNAFDGLDDERRRTDAGKQIPNLASIGLKATNFDLRDFTPGNIESAFGYPGFLWVRGGNVFTLRMAMARFGLDQIVVDGLAANRFVYAGFSAGPACSSPAWQGWNCATPSKSAARRTATSASMDSQGSTVPSCRT